MAVTAEQILDLLPQTQCTRCGYPDCAGYAQAIANGQAPINQCPPGGHDGIERLAALTGQAVQPLNPAHGVQGPRSVAVIDEAWCIGCTLCIKACPTDAIFGTHKRMHTVVEPYCTGCALCLPVCPVDCIVMENASGTATGWQAWSSKQANTARERYAFHSYRVKRDQVENTKRLEAKAQAKLDDLARASQITDAQELERKRAIVQAALNRARAQRSEPTKR